MEIRKLLLGLFLLKDELDYFHQSLDNESNIINKFRLIKQNLIILNTFLESLNKFNPYVKQNQELKLKTRSIRKRGELINHMRNKIGGHLDEDVLIRSAQWTPHIFHKTAKENRDSQILLSYKSIIEASINSYIDLSDNEKQKEFGKEIDLTYPPDETLFYNYLGDLNSDSIEWIKTVIKIIEKDFEYFDDEETLYQSKIAGLTDFNLKKEFSLPEKEELKGDELVQLAEEAFKEVDATKKSELLNKLIEKIEVKKVASKNYI
jgi:hypothetical protein